MFRYETIGWAYFSFYDAVKFSLILSLNTVSVPVILFSSSKTLMNFRFNINIFYIFILFSLEYLLQCLKFVLISLVEICGFFFFSV